MTAEHPQPSDVSAVVCTKNSIVSIRACLESLIDSGVGEIVVVDASSTDGTREIVDALADVTLEDSGDGLGRARNIGISVSTKSYILNAGSDNIFPPHEIQRMLDWLNDTRSQGVSAQTQVVGHGLVSRGLNAWRKGRFRPGPSLVIGTPSLLRGHLLRVNPYDPDRRFSDDSELCERWIRDLGAKFEVSDALILEDGKNSWREVMKRTQMYGESDYEVWLSGIAHGWPWQRKLQSLLHPLKVDLLQPISRLGMRESLLNAPFLATFVIARYVAWFSVAVRAKT